MTVIIVGIVILVIAAGSAGVHFYQRAHQAKGATLHFRCPNCRRRLSFSDNHRGHQGQCPQCRGYFDFPMESDEERRAKRRQR